MQIVEKPKELLSSAVSCFQVSFCGQLLGRICNAKVCWSLLLLLPVVLWTTALIVGLVRNAITPVYWFFWVAIVLGSPLLIIPFYVVHQISRGWGGPVHYCLRVDGRDFPCFGTRTQHVQGGPSYVALPRSSPFHGVGVYQITPDEEAPCSAPWLPWVRWSQNSTIPTTTEVM
jgi:hypothetical protein